MLYTVDLQLEGKSVLVTGGSKGIGLACARTFAQEGCRVHLASRDRERLEQARKQLQGAASIHPADLRDANALQALAQVCGEVDIWSTTRATSRAARSSRWTTRNGATRGS
jgi:NAD(P)-dependent dehydrogenase (short-subunit alcohol dehydrogenase family)